MPSKPTLTPIGEVSDLAPSSLRRNIKIGQCFAIKLHRWFVLSKGVVPTKPKQLPLFE